ncbi:MAG: sigma-E processing peptidase SpoIIGA [Oscillospiraceae bacterium]|nr:sigma-E processing peptidase SpoIIGA [Oscillospiraceae bacterium]MBQ3049225.1 sigma-E processing peptidase SpoIIGA [Oscillospiraceae bacterium]MBQ9938086.1 sigma-E processing peptidase SpoIIGA [Oscillospiraceae bacterium]
MPEQTDVIYIDILLAINLAVNYFLLLSSLKLCGRAPLRRRILLGAFAGALYSLIILLPEIPWLIQALTRAACCVFMVFICEFPIKRRELFTDCAVFFVVSFVFAGFMLAVRMFLSPAFLLYSNGIVYLKTNALTLIISALSAYLVTELFRRIFRKKTFYAAAPIPGKTDVTITFHGKTVTCSGFADTGNTLTDPLSGSPVIIADISVAAQLLSAEMLSALDSPIENAKLLGAGTLYGFRLIPYSTVSGSGLLPVFRPENISIISNGKNYMVQDVLLGFSTQNELCLDGTVILNPEILLNNSSPSKNKAEEHIL